MSTYHVAIRIQEQIKNKHNAELQRTDLGTKDKWTFSIRDVFSHIMPKIDYLFIPIVLVGKKTH